MALNRIKPFWVGGAFFGLVFGVLFLIRLDLFNEIFSGSKTPSVFFSDTIPERDTWMNIFQQDDKIGFSHKTFAKEENGYRIQETVFMRINTMGLVQDINLKTHGKLNSDFTISSLDYEINSGRFRFAAHGSVSGKTLTIKTHSAGSTRSFDIKVKKKPYLVAGILDALRAGGLKPGDKYTFDIFDPATMGQEPVKVSVIEEEEVLNMGIMKKATKVLLNFKGNTQLAWIGADGEVLKEKGLFGIRLEKTTREDALLEFATGSIQDLTLIASIPSNVDIENTARLDRLKVEVDGIHYQDVYLHGGRQTLVGNILTVNRESISDLPANYNRDDLDILKKIFLQPSPFIQSDHKKIEMLAKEIVGSNDDIPLNKAKKLVDWVHKNIRKRPVLSLPDALSTLENREGDCNEHAVLLAALTRSAGIPARVEAGLVYLKGRFYYHAWNLLYLGKWITADALFGQMPADVTHIRFTTGAQQQINLMSIIGKVELKVIEP
jgi:hypothetical protein